jgi:hypothetical protein
VEDRAVVEEEGRAVAKEVDRVGWPWQDYLARRVRLWEGFPLNLRQPIRLEADSSL